MSVNRMIFNAVIRGDVIFDSGVCGDRFARWGEFRLCRTVIDDRWNLLAVSDNQYRLAITTHFALEIARKYRRGETK